MKLAQAITNLKDVVFALDLHYLCDNISLIGYVF